MFSVSKLLLIFPSNYEVTVIVKKNVIVGKPLTGVLLKGRIFFQFSFQVPFHGHPHPSCLEWEVVFSHVAQSIKTNLKVE